MDQFTMLLMMDRSEVRQEEKSNKFHNVLAFFARFGSDNIKTNRL